MSFCLILIQFLQFSKCVCKPKILFTFYFLRLPLLVLSTLIWISVSEYLKLNFNFNFNLNLNLNFNFNLNLNFNLNFNFNFFLNLGKLLGDQPDMKQFHGLLKNTDFDNLQFVKKKTYHLNCNWKVFIDNYLGR